MAENDKPRSRARTWDDARRRAPPWRDAFVAAVQPWRARLSQWVLADVAPGRLAPWLAVAFGFGIVLYFTAQHEPQLWATILAALIGVCVSIATRRRPVTFPLALAIAAIASGFAVATIKTRIIQHPVLPATIGSVTLSGFVEIRDERERTDRIVIRIHKMDAPRLTTRLERVRISVRKGTAPAVGAFVELKARLSPPLQELRPGGYDFARDLYFQRLGASGFALGAVKTVEPPVAPGLRLRFAAMIDSVRDGIDNRIRAALPGDKGSIASALITGKRDAISAPVNDAMYVSSLAHVLSISGYHMAVVAGIIFFLVRASLALSASAASRYPIKKWAAVAALVGAAFYLVLSGAEVATQRSFIMIAIVLVGVMVDRPAFTLRTLTVAALCVLLIAPESVVHPSFQMSFAATLALVAGYRYALPWQANADTSLSARAALWGGREIIGLILASLVAGLATTPYAAFHFHRVAPYGVLANLLAMPVVSAWVMPMGILGLIAMPFGLDSLFWQLMGAGLDWMIAVALWVTSLPGAVGRVPAFGVGALLLGSFGLVLICLLRTPLRMLGVACVMLACLWAYNTPKPDIFLAGDGQTAAVRTAGGKLSVMRAGSDTFAIRDWLGADGDSRDVKDASLRDGVRCDEAACIATLANGKLVSFALTVEAFEEDCRRAVVVLSPRTAPADCSALLVDREAWRRSGAVALRQLNSGFERIDARPNGYDRPWAAAVAPSADRTAPTSPAAPRDATPRLDDLEAGD